MILVTGATGYIGRRIVSRLVEQGQEVRCLVRTSSDLSPLKGLQVQVHRGEVADPASLMSACEGVEAVVHTVGIIREQGTNTFERTNHIGTRNLVEAARGAGVKRLVYLSAIGAGPDPKLPYLYSKWQGEQTVSAAEIPHVILRPSIVFGRGDEFINALAAAVRLGPIVPIIGSGKNRFQPIFVDDLVRCVERILKDEAYDGRVLEIGGPEHLTYRDIVDAIIRTFGRRRLKVRVPLIAMRLLAPLLGLLTPHPPITPAQLKMINLDNIAEPDSVERDFGFQPRPLGGNIDYILDMGRREALAMVLGLRPARRW